VVGFATGLITSICLDERTKYKLIQHQTSHFCFLPPQNLSDDAEEPSIEWWNSH
jgi:hypothetical protein